MLKRNKHTKLIILIDPDKYNRELVKNINHCKVACIFVGGSILKKNNLNQVISDIKKLTNLPVIIFPGDEKQISYKADAMLILSLLSGKNPDYLITKLKKAALEIKKTKIKTISTAYVLVDGGKLSTTEKVTGTLGLKTKNEVVSVCVAADLLGKELIYLEAGSGAKRTIKSELIDEVRKFTSLPLIVGGGINTIEKAKKIIDANPDYMVIGNALEQNPLFIFELNKLINK